MALSRKCSRHYILVLYVEREEEATRHRALSINVRLIYLLTADF